MRKKNDRKCVITYSLFRLVSFPGIVTIYLIKTIIRREPNCMAAAIVLSKCLSLCMHTTTSEVVVAVLLRIQKIRATVTKSSI